MLSAHPPLLLGRVAVLSFCRIQGAIRIHQISVTGISRVFQTAVTEAEYFIKHHPPVTIVGSLFHTQCVLPVFPFSWF